MGWQGLHLHQFFLVCETQLCCLNFIWHLGTVTKWPGGLKCVLENIGLDAICWNLQLRGQIGILQLEDLVRRGISSSKPCKRKSTICSIGFNWSFMQPFWQMGGLFIAMFIDVTTRLSNKLTIEWQINPESPQYVGILVALCLTPIITDALASYSLRLVHICESFHQTHTLHDAPTQKILRDHMKTKWSQTDVRKPSETMGRSQIGGPALRRLGWGLWVLRYRWGRLSAARCGRLW